MTLRPIESLEEATRVFPVMKTLRTHLDLPRYLELLSAAREQSGYTLWGAFDSEQKCIGLMGYRILVDFVHGKHLYVDDLVVVPDCRSHGIGAEFLEKARELAKSAGCQMLRLCTGVDNDEGKRFYARNGWELRAVAYKRPVK